MPKKKFDKTRFVIWGVSGVVVLAFLGLAYGAFALLLSDDESRVRRVHTVTLLKPPPPPKVKEKPPEQEVKKKEEIIEQQEEPEPEEMDETVEDQGPMDDDLGLNADGTDGSDGFGLRAKKGGRDLIGGDFSMSNLLRKYAWYTSILQEDLRKKVKQYMESHGGMPDGKLVAHVKISLQESGRVTGVTIEQSSGDKKMDKAVHEALLMTSVSEPPPEGMPRVLRLKISSKG